MTPADVARHRCGLQAAREMDDVWEACPCLRLSPRAA